MSLILGDVFSMLGEAYALFSMSFIAPKPVGYLILESLSRLLLSSSNFSCQFEQKCRELANEKELRDVVKIFW